MTRDASRSRRSLPALAAATTLAAAALTGCSWMSPVQTDRSYSPADGVDVTLGKVKVTNLLIVSEKKDAPGTVVGQVTNDGDEETTLAIGTDGGSPVMKKLPPHSVMRLDQAGVTVPSVPVAPGAMTSLNVGTQASGSNPTNVPVLAAEGPYATVTPSPANTLPETMTPTATMTTMAPASPAPTATTTATQTVTTTASPAPSATH